MIIGINGYINSGKDTVGKIIQELTKKPVPGYVSINEGKITPALEGSVWQKKKFAGKLKQIASLLTGIPVEKFENQEFKKTFLGKEWDRILVPDIEKSKYYPAECSECGWLGSSSQLEGGGQLADTGDYDDVYCPKCWSNKIEDTDNVHPMTVREFLQKLGTEAVRNGLHTNTWVNATFADYKPGGGYPEYGVTEKGDRIAVGYNAFEESKWIITDCRFPNEAQAVKDRGGIVIRVNRPEDKPEYETLEEYSARTSNRHPSETSLDNWNFDWEIDNDDTMDILIRKVKEMLLHFNILTREVVNNQIN
jgi:hypothetical protein